MIMCFAGSDGVERYNKILKRNGAIGRLESYHTLKKMKPSNFAYYLLDSGGFVARNRGITISVEKYADFINKYNVRNAFELDTSCIKETMHNRKYLQAKTKAYIIPIYHFSDYKTRNFKMLDDMCKQYKYIAIGGIVGANIPRKYEHILYDYVFNKTRNKVRVHGLGITSQGILEKYPWFSVDSTSWLAMARYGSSKVQDKQTMKYYSKTKHYLDNTEKEVIWWIDLQNYITKLWQKKGVHWETN